MGICVLFLVVNRDSGFFTHNCIFNFYKILWPWKGLELQIELYGFWNMFSYIMKHFYTCEIHSTKTSGMWANRKYNRITPLEINKSFVMMKGRFRSRSTWLLTKHDNFNPEYDLILRVDLLLFVCICIHSIWW